MKRVIAVLVLLSSCLVFAESTSSIGLTGGYGYTKYYDGGVFGIRYQHSLKPWVAIGFDALTSLGMNHTDAAREGKADFMRLHAFFRFSKSFGKFEPYLLGSFGKGLTAENLQDFPELSAANAGDSRAQTAWGAGLSIGLLYNVGHYYVGGEWSLTHSVLDYGQLGLQVGWRF